MWPLFKQDVKQEVFQEEENRFSSIWPLFKQEIKHEVSEEVGQKYANGAEDFKDSTTKAKQLQIQLPGKVEEMESAVLGFTDKTESEYNSDSVYRVNNLNNSVVDNLNSIQESRTLTLATEYLLNDNVLGCLNNSDCNCGTCKEDLKHCRRSTIQKLTKHIKSKVFASSYIDTYKCIFCDASFTEMSSLITHKTVHIGEDKPYRCHICVASFTRKSSLKIHKILHTGNKPYKCDVCIACFTHKSNFYKHKAIHTGDKPHKCDVCAACFTNESKLCKHKEIHTGDKPYKCDICASCFTNKSNLCKHKEIHTGDKPYKCDICAASFLRMSNLTKHTTVHEADT